MIRCGMHVAGAQLCASDARRAGMSLARQCGFFFPNVGFFLRPGFFAGAAGCAASGGAAASAGAAASGGGGGAASIAIGALAGTALPPPLPLPSDVALPAAAGGFELELGQSAYAPAPTAPAPSTPITAHLARDGRFTGAGAKSSADTTVPFHATL